MPDLKLFELSPSASSFRASPKRSRIERAGVADLFPYYAGYSYAWARDQIASMRLDPEQIVLDPWNGSGTTTSAAGDLGVSAIGVDLNPVASVVAQARIPTEGLADAYSLLPGTSPSRLRATDPLRSWFTPRTGLQIRRWSKALETCSQSDRNVGLLALFVVVRRLTKSFEGSNPTWVRKAQHGQEKIDVPTLRLDESIREQLQDIRQRLAVMTAPDPIPTILTASSKNLPIDTASVDAIVTSPPYLTRIDYAVAYARELAVLDLDISSRARELRSSLMGTTLIRPSQAGRDQPSAMGTVTRELLESIATHPSKDSSGYYLKQALQYAADLSASIAEMTRVARPAALGVVVVQDSYYKEVPVRLAKMVSEEASSRGWMTEGIEEFPVSRLLTSINTPAMSYDKGQVAESVIYLRRLTDDNS